MILFYLSWRKQHGQLLNKRLIQSELFVSNLLLFEHQQKNCSLTDSFLDPMA